MKLLNFHRTVFTFFVLALFWSCANQDDSDLISVRSTDETANATSASSTLTEEQLQEQVDYLKSIGYTFTVHTDSSGNITHIQIHLPAWHQEEGGSGTPPGGFPSNIPAGLDASNPAPCGFICDDDCATYGEMRGTNGWCYGDCETIPYCPPLPTTGTSQDLHAGVNW